MSQLQAGLVLGGRYLLISRIATGGMGEVWRARDRRTRHLVAAKVLRPELTGEEISLSRLRLEAQNAMRSQHPNIASILDSGEEDGQGWIIMELVEGDPLSDYVGDGNVLEAKHLIPVLVQCAYALDGIARAGIVHRDIKPANIIVRPDGLAKLTDFGISHASGQAELTAAGMVMGTAQYLAPEQAMGQEATPSGDLYSLGIIAYEALAGHRPFTGKTVVDIATAHVNDTPPPLPENVPEPLAKVVYSLLAKSPESRPRNGTALVRQLTAVAQELQISTRPTPLRGTTTAPATTTATPAGTTTARERQAPPTPTRTPPTPAQAERTHPPAVAATNNREAKPVGKQAVFAWKPVTGTGSTASGAANVPLPSRNPYPKRSTSSFRKATSQLTPKQLLPIGVLLILLILFFIFLLTKNVTSHAVVATQPVGNSAQQRKELVVATPPAHNSTQPVIRFHQEVL